MSSQPPVKSDFSFGRNETIGRWQDGNTEFLVPVYNILLLWGSRWQRYTSTRLFQRHSIKPLASLTHLATLRNSSQNVTGKISSFPLWAPEEHLQTSKCSYNGSTTSEKDTFSRTSMAWYDTSRWTKTWRKGGGGRPTEKVIRKRNNLTLGKNRIKNSAKMDKSSSTFVPIKQYIHGSNKQLHLFFCAAFDRLISTPTHVFQQYLHRRIITSSIHSSMP